LQTKIMVKVLHDDHCPLAHVIDKREAERLNVAALCEATCKIVQFLGAMETVTGRGAYQPIADALATLPADDLTLDGEAAVADSRGVPGSGCCMPISLLGARTGCSGERDPGETPKWRRDVRARS
jgi:hypothetical protein